MRDIPVGNGSLLVAFDNLYQIRDLYFPHVGQENHVGGAACRFGVWADGKFAWTADDGWTRDLTYLSETLVTAVTLTNADMAVRLVCNDTVASHDNLFLRRVRVENLAGARREIRVFLHHDLRIYENPVGDTAFFDPATKSLIHYKKHRYFLFNTEPPFASFATGRKAFREQEGTWRDAEDGYLSGGPKTEGSVDSTLGVHLEIDAAAAAEFYYWIAVGTDCAEVERLNRLVIERSPQEYLAYTSAYWRAWVNKNETDLSGLSETVVRQYKRSLLIIRTQIDNDGAILAANDSDVTQRATDHYSYLWTRDGAFVANALDRAGYSHLTRLFFDFCARIVDPKGYFLQKYNADGTVASGWHSSWDAARGREIVPIQEDETALVIWAMWEHYEKYRDIEFAHRNYKGLTVACADFMADFRDGETGLPAPSWNLWEDQRGIHTFTAAAVVAGLRAAANFAELFSESNRAARYRGSAHEIVAAMSDHLYSVEHGRFLRAIAFGDGDARRPDATVDASLFATFYFGAFAADDLKVAKTMAVVKQILSTGEGFARFENDAYMRMPSAAAGNVWFICSLWFAEYLIAAAKSDADLDEAKHILEWVAASALPSGVLAEQLDMATGEHISVSPLTWSHSTFVAAALSLKAALDRRQTK